MTQISEVLAWAKTKSTDASSSLPTTNAIRYAPIRISEAQREPEPRLPAPVELVARRLLHE